MAILGLLVVVRGLWVVPHEPGDLPTVGDPLNWRVRLLQSTIFLVLSGAVWSSWHFYPSLCRPFGDMNGFEM